MTVPPLVTRSRVPVPKLVKRAADEPAALETLLVVNAITTVRKANEMRTSSRIYSRAVRALIIFTFVLGLTGTASFLTGAHAPSTSVTIVNNTGMEIRHLYLSSTSEENWGADQLDPTVISVGGTYNLSDVGCSASDIKVIAEDQDGCFFYKVVSCGESTTWTITSSSARDCGN